MSSRPAGSSSLSQKVKNNTYSGEFLTDKYMYINLEGSAHVGEVRIFVKHTPVKQYFSYLLVVCGVLKYIQVTL